MIVRPGVSLFLALCAWFPAPPAIADGHPPLWRIQGRDNVVYLLGSVHVLRATDDALPASVLRAYAESETLYMEVDLDDLDPLQAQEFTLERGVLPEDQTLRELLGDGRYDEARDEALNMGVDLDILSQLEPWVVAITLAQAQFLKLGLDPEAGVEQRLMQLAVRDGKEIRGLESLADQLTALDSLSLERQRDFLLMSLEEANDLPSIADELIGAWTRGDTAALARSLSKEFEGFPELYRTLIVDRNRKWADEIAPLLDDKQDYLIVVGALHLVGDDSLIELLRGRGHPAQRQ